MRSRTVALAAAVAALFVAPCARAQEGEEARTAEQMIEVAREVWRSPDLRPCPQSTPDEIVVCAPDSEEFRVESSMDEAIRKGEAPPDPNPRAPYVLGLPECGVEVQCYRVGRTPTRPLIIDLAALPHPLTREEAAHVYRAENLPAETARPEAALPEAAQ
ncbi:MAG TPA: hypothetical protein VI168_04460 [Croceibacterium sp.]